MKQLPYNYIVRLDYPISKHQFGQITVGAFQSQMPAVNPAQTSQMVVQAASMPVDSGIQGYLNARGQNMQRRMFDEEMALKEQELEMRKEEHKANLLGTKINLLDSLNEMSSQAAQSYGLNPSSEKGSDGIMRNMAQIDQFRLEQGIKANMQQKLVGTVLSGDFNEETVQEAYGLATTMKNFYLDSADKARVQLSHVAKELEYVEKTQDENYDGLYGDTEYTRAAIAEYMSYEKESSLDKRLNFTILDVNKVAKKYWDNVIDDKIHDSRSVGDFELLIEETNRESEGTIVENMKGNQELKNDLKKKYDLGLGVSQDKDGNVEDFETYFDREVRSAVKATYEHKFEVLESQFVGEKGSNRNNRNPSGKTDEEVEEIVDRAKRTHFEKLPTVHSTQDTENTTVHEELDLIQEDIEKINKRIEVRKKQLAETYSGEDFEEAVKNDRHINDLEAKKSYKEQEKEDNLKFVDEVSGETTDDVFDKLKNLKTKDDFLDSRKEQKGLNIFDFSTATHGPAFAEFMSERIGSIDDLEEKKGEVDNIISEWRRIENSDRSLEELIEDGDVNPDNIITDNHIVVEVLQPYKKGTTPLGNIIERDGKKYVQRTKNFKTETEVHKFTADNPNLDIKVVRNNEKGEQHVGELLLDKFTDDPNNRAVEEKLKIDNQGKSFQDLSLITVAEDEKEKPGTVGYAVERAKKGISLGTIGKVYGANGTTLDAVDAYTDIYSSNPDSFIDMDELIANSQFHATNTYDGDGNYLIRVTPPHKTANGDDLAIKTQFQKGFLLAVDPEYGKIVEQDLKEKMTYLSTVEGSESEVMKIAENLHVLNVSKNILPKFREQNIHKMAKGSQRTFMDIPVNGEEYDINVNRTESGKYYFSDNEGDVIEFEVNGKREASFSNYNDLISNYTKAGGFGLNSDDVLGSVRTEFLQQDDDGNTYIINTDPSKFGEYGITQEMYLEHSFGAPVAQLLDENGSFDANAHISFPEFLSDLPIKYKNNSTVPLNTIASTFTDLTTSGGQAFQGGVNDPSALIAVGAISQGLDNFNRVTGQNDNYHQNERPGSDHTKGFKVDFTINTTGQTHEEIQEEYNQAATDASTILQNKYNLVEGEDFKFISKKHGTDWHLDFALNPSGRQKVTQTEIKNAKKKARSLSREDQRKVAETRLENINNSLINVKQGGIFDFSDDPFIQNSEVFQTQNRQERQKVITALGYKLGVDEARNFIMSEGEISDRTFNQYASKFENNEIMQNKNFVKNFTVKTISGFEKLAKMNGEQYDEEFVGTVSHILRYINENKSNIGTLQGFLNKTVTTPNGDITITPDLMNELVTSYIYGDIFYSPLYKRN